MTIGLISDGELGSSVRGKLNDVITHTNTATGWGSYIDTQYPNAANTFTIVADTDVTLPNNAGTILETQKPTDVTTFYDGSLITGREGDSIDFLAYFSAIPSANGQWLEVWVDIGGIGKRYSQTYLFPKGIGEERGIVYSLPSLYQGSSWQANGASVKVRSNNTLNIHTINYNLDRSHKAR